MSAPLCTVCLDTGSKSQDLYSELDCTACNAAIERVALMRSLKGKEDSRNVCALTWRAYQLGKAAAAAKLDVSMLIDMLAIQEACGLHTDEYAPGSVIEYIKELEADSGSAAPVVPVAAQPVVPEGWQLVPVEPTQNMCLAARGVPDPLKPYPPHFHLIWDAMLAAAPQPAASVTDVAKDAVAYAIFKVMKTGNMIDKDWHEDVILGLDNEFRNQINQAAKDAIDAAIAAQQGEKTK